MSSLPWPACVPNGVPGATTVPVNDSPIGQKTVCDLYTIDLSSTFTCKAEAVGKRIRRGGGTEVWGCGALFFALVPVVYLLRNLRHRRVQRPYAVVHTYPVDRSKQWPGPNGCAILPPTYVAYR